MKYSLQVSNAQSINEIPEYWGMSDYVNLLGKLDYSDVAGSGTSELRELLEMALSDCEPHESAHILLKYKLEGELSKGQIFNMSHEMADDNESEENADITLHYALFNINQLLHAAYGGVFPNAKATKIDFALRLKGAPDITMTKEIALKAICSVLSESSPVVRLFAQQINGEEPFADAEHIIWELHHKGSDEYTLITSDYWVSKNDVVADGKSGKIKFFED